MSLAIRLINAIFQFLGEPAPAGLSNVEIPLVKGALVVIEVVKDLLLFNASLHPDVIVHSRHLFVVQQRDVLRFDLVLRELLLHRDDYIFLLLQDV